MNAKALQHLSRSITAAVATALLAACAADTPLAPDSRLAPDAPSAARVDLGTCDYLRAPEGSTFAFHAYAKGVQIYRWSGSAWLPVGPAAELFADARFTGLVGTHFAGPRWQSLSGSTVRGEVIDRCTYDANAIPWLSLRGIPENGPGVFAHTTFIQRVNTVGGKAPSAPGALDEVVEVPYTAEYYFYRAP